MPLDFYLWLVISFYYIGALACFYRGKAYPVLSAERGIHRFYGWVFLIMGLLFSTFVNLAFH